MGKRIFVHESLRREIGVVWYWLLGVAGIGLWTSEFSRIVWTRRPGCKGFPQEVDTSTLDSSAAIGIGAAKGPCSVAVEESGMVDGARY